MDNNKSSLIINHLNRPWPAAGPRPCWDFCRRVFSYYDTVLPDVAFSGLEKIDEPVVPCIVLMKLGPGWHTGVVWPDGLHLIHARPTDKKGKKYVVVKNSLTDWPWRMLIEGYYKPKEKLKK